MKKYWKLITIVVIIVLAVGTFYIHSSVTADNYPNFVLEKKSGDAKAVEHLTLQGDYRKDLVGDNVYITADGSTYAGSASLFNQRSWIINQPKITRLQEDYQSFMRGKGTDAGSFAENEASLAYVDMKWDMFEDYESSRFSFDVAVLDKESQSKSSFTAVVPKKDKYDDVYIEGIFILNGDLKVITHNMLKTSNDKSWETELHVYNIDMDKEKIVDDKMVISGSEKVDADEWVELNAVSDGGDTPSKYMVFTKSLEKVIEDDEGLAGSGDKKQEFIVYNLETGKQEKLELPEKMKQDTYAESLNDTTIYFSKMMEDQIEITAYDMEDNKWKKEQIFNLPSIENAEEMDERLFKINGDKIFISSTREKLGTSVIVADLNSGKTVYEGTVETKDKNSSLDGYRLYILDLMIE